MRQQWEAWGWKVTGRLRRSLVENVEYSLPHLFAVGLVGVVGFPLYYWVWTELFPQPYESLALRLIGAVLFLGLAFANRWPRRLQTLFPAYWFISILYALPFFFTFMLLKNDGNTVWAMSTMAGLTLLILIAHDWVLSVVMFVLGSVLAVAAHAFTTAGPVTYDAYMAQAPIYAFVVVAGSVFNYNAARLKQEKLQVLASVGANIAHELRTPLLTIKTSAGGLMRYMPQLLAGYRAAGEHGLLERAIPEERYRALDSALRRIDNEVDNSNVVIDMLLFNLSRPNVDVEFFAPHRMSTIIDNALQRYPFHSPDERDKIRVATERDFEFWGSDQLMVHVIFNLLKNALQSINKLGRGHIVITLQHGERINRVVFEDTGGGIPARELPYIFDSFYSSKKTGGSGIGLSFCKQIMVHFNGRISCASVEGQYTRFVLSFPPVAEQHAAPAPTAPAEPLPPVGELAAGKKAD